MKKILMAIMIVTVIGVFLGQVLAVTDPGYNPGLVDDNIKGKTADVWATVAVVVRVAAVACVVFAGLRYMFASADQKADVKQGMIYLAIGAVLVFGATYVINLVVGSAKEIIN